jgi:hypothetical protein
VQVGKRLELGLHRLEGHVVRSLVKLDHERMVAHDRRTVWLHQKGFCVLTAAESTVGQASLPENVQFWSRIADKFDANLFGDEAASQAVGRRGMDMKPSRFTAALLCFHEQVTLAMATLVLYLITRIWVLARRGELPGGSGAARGARLAQSDHRRPRSRAVAGGDAVRTL